MQYIDYNRLTDWLVVQPMADQQLTHDIMSQLRTPLFQQGRRLCGFSLVP